MHDSLREHQDRSFTRQLLAGPLDEEIAQSLEILADPRSFQPLLQQLESDGADSVRRLAGQVWRSWGHGTPSATLRRWWSQGDEVLRQHALLEMGRDCADLVEPVAQDPSHPLHRDAIATMLFGFEAPRFQLLKIAALDHPEAGVRETAADVLMWDEPASAEPALVRALADRVPGVARAAIDTLRYYPSLAVLEQLGLAASEHPDEGVRDCAVDAREQLLDQMARAASHLGEAGRERLLSWLAPVRDELPPIPEDIFSSAPASAPFPPADELVARYSELDQPWRPLWDRFPREAQAAPKADRPRLTRWVLAHPDPELRCRAACWLAAWGERDALLWLLEDPCFSVRKTAMYQLSTLPADPSLAPLAWQHLHAPATASTHAYETLRTWVVHAPRALALQRLPELALHDERESVRHHAVHSLTELGESSAFTELIPLLTEPPSVTWGVHCALLEAARKLGIPLPQGTLQRLASVDHLSVQEALARHPSVQP